MSTRKIGNICETVQRYDIAAICVLKMPLNPNKSTNQPTETECLSGVTYGLTFGTKVDC